MSDMGLGSNVIFALNRDQQVLINLPFVVVGPECAVPKFLRQDLVRHPLGLQPHFAQRPLLHLAQGVITLRRGHNHEKDHKGSNNGG